MTPELLQPGVPWKGRLLRRCPFVVNRQLGSFSLRDIDLAHGKLQPSAAESKAIPTMELINAALAAANVAELQSPVASLDGGRKAIDDINAAMKPSISAGSGPNFAKLALKWIG